MTSKGEMKDELARARSRIKELEAQLEAQAQAHHDFNAKRVVRHREALHAALVTGREQQANAATRSDQDARAKLAALQAEHGQVRCLLEADYDETLLEAAQRVLERSFIIEQGGDDEVGRDDDDDVGIPSF